MIDEPRDINSEIKEEKKESPHHIFKDDRIYNPDTGQYGWWSYGGFTTDVPPNWDGRLQ